MLEICQVRPTRHKFLNYYSPDVIFDIRADIKVHTISISPTVNSGNRLKKYVRVM